MANRTDPAAKRIRGTNPQNLVEKILRSKNCQNTYWKEQCFGLTAETLVDKAMELDHLGGTFSGNRKPTPDFFFTNELEAAKSEIQTWRSAFQNEPYIPAGTTPTPKLVNNYVQSLKSREESLREQLEKAKKKEAAFIVTFAKREQEIAELKSAVLDLKAQLHPASMQARRLLLDPAVHEEFTRLKNLVEEKDKKVKELQDNIAAVNFTPQSKMGKMLMAKCKTLQEENEEIGNQASEGKMQELASKLSLQKHQNAELRSQFEGLQKLMDGLTNDVERSNETVLMLQGKMEERDEEIQRLKDELQKKRSMEQGRTEAASNREDSDEMAS